MNVNVLYRNSRRAAYTTQRVFKNGRLPLTLLVWVFRANPWNSVWFLTKHTGYLKVPRTCSKGFLQESNKIALVKKIPDKFIYCCVSIIFYSWRRGRACVLVSCSVYDGKARIFHHERQSFYSFWKFGAIMGLIKALTILSIELLSLFATMSSSSAASIKVCVPAALGAALKTAIACAEVTIVDILSSSVVMVVGDFSRQVLLRH